MKVIVTGCTGLIGGEVLAQALKHPQVTEVVALSRRQLPAQLAANDKLTTVLLDDFEVYSEDTLQKLNGAGACVWALGLAKPSNGLDEYRRINLTYLQRGLEAFGSKLAPNAPSGKFHFAYVSGAAAVRDAEKSQSLWFMGDVRRIRGESESATLDAAKTYAQFDTYVYRPGFVLGASRGFMHGLLGQNYSIKLSELAAALLDTALNGTAIENTVENPAAIVQGRSALKSLAQAQPSK